MIQLRLLNMSSTLIALYAFLMFTFIYLLYTLLFLYPKQRPNDQKLPPGPPPLPIIGNLHMLGSLPHRSLQSLSKKYGPIMSLKLGQVPAIVVSSSEAAELFLKTHDIVFASHPKIQVSDLISYGSKGLAFTEYGPYWRSVRKLCTLELLSTSKVQLFAPIRKEELGVVVELLQKEAATGDVVNLSKVVENLIKDIMCKMILGPNKSHGVDLKKLVHEAIIILGDFNLADYVPWLGAFDIQGLTRGCKKICKALDRVLEKIITEHEEAAIEDKKHPKDFVDVLVSMMHQPIDPQSEQHLIIDRTNIKAILLDIIMGTLESSAAAIEWALSELLRHPRVMRILQDEIKNEVGMRRMVEETDLTKFSYLNMVVDETLRLHPSAPLIPRECRESITIDGYFIKEKTRVMINVWTIGRDPNVWSDNAETFYPERFVNKKINYHGHDFESIPFGSGRRSCPGIQLGLVTIRMVIAQLVHCFNWELPSNVSPANLSMQEKFGLAVPRAEKLHTIPTYRLASDAN